MELESVARRVDDVGVALAEVARRLESSRPNPADLGAAGSGRLGELGQAFSHLAAGAIMARAAEARSLGRAASALSETITRATVTYRDADDHRADTHRGGGL